MKPSNATPFKGRAVTDTEFRILMNSLGGFENRPTVAVAVSGGADSMALAILVDRWARRRHGRLVALTVDHGLRVGSRAEAKQAHRRLADRGIDCQLLVWRGDKPRSGVQAAARDARYGLMAQWCRRHDVLHLLVAHHREDQAETILHRLARTSGIDGLAGMAAIHELQDIRLLRPCLSLSQERLRAVLLKNKINWTEDPSNDDAGYTRVRLRALLPVLASEGMDAVTLLGTARRMASARSALEASLAGFLSSYVALFPEGYARINLAAFSATDPEIARRVLIALLTTIGGKIYPPRQANLQLLYEELLRHVGKAPRSCARTLGGCHIVSAGGNILICREEGRCEILAASQGTTVLWDKRFLVQLPGPSLRKGRERARTHTIKALGEAGWATIRPKINDPVAEYLPHLVRLALPAIHNWRGIVAVPHLEFYNAPSVSNANVRFMPAKSATSAGFPVV